MRSLAAPDALKTEPYELVGDALVKSLCHVNLRFRLPLAYG